MATKKNNSSGYFVNPSFGLNKKRTTAGTLNKNFNFTPSLDLYDKTVLEPTKSSLDYRIWVATAWVGPNNDSTKNIWSRTDIYGVTNPNYVFKGIVPMVFMPMCDYSVAPFQAQNAYNGVRYPATTRINPSTGQSYVGAQGNGLPGSIAETGYTPRGNTSTYNSYDNWFKFKDSLNFLPESRRICFGYYFQSTLNFFAASYPNFYKKTTDGTEYPSGSGNRFPTIWHDQQLIDTQSSYREFLRFCKTQNIKFDYFMDNREAEPFFLLTGYNNTSHDETNNSPLAITNTSSSYTNTDTAAYFADARFFSALIADPRFTSKINPKTGKTFSQEFIFHFEKLWKTHWFFKNITYPNPTWQDLLSPWMNETTLTNFDGKNPADWWCFYGCDSNDRLYSAGVSCITNTTCSALGSALGGGEGPGSQKDIPSAYKKYLNINGYVLFHLVCPAWEATAENWVYNHYIREQIVGTHNETEFKNYFGHVQLIQYQKHPISAEDCHFYQTSNLSPYYVNPIQDCILGAAYYGTGSGNVLSPVKNAPYINVNNSVALNVSNSAWRSAWSYRSGYVQNPQDDNEKYNWVGYGDGPPSGTKSCETNLVRYPITTMVDSSGNLLSQNFYKYTTEFAFKVLVDSIKKTRLAIREDWNYKKYWTPWINDPTWGQENLADYTSRSHYNWSFGYWIEEMYHILLHSPVFLTYWTSRYETRFGGAPAVQFILDQWRTISKNLPITPCSNSDADVNKKVDRLILSDAFEKVLISGAKVDGSETRIWRISVAPKYFGNNGIATLQKISSHPDLPNIIEINCNEDRHVKSADVIANTAVWGNLNVHNSRGCWLITKYNTVPQYIPIVPKSLPNSDPGDNQQDPPSTIGDVDDGIVRIFPFYDNTIS